MWHQDHQILVPHDPQQEDPGLEVDGIVAENLYLSYRPPTLLHLVGKCTEAAKTCALSLRKGLQHFLKLKIQRIFNFEIELKD